MCGRFVLVTSVPELARRFSAYYEPTMTERWRPSWNIAPGRPVIAVAISSGTKLPTQAARPVPERCLGLYRWGLVPPWAKDASFGARTFNARAETVATKPAFRSAFRSRRAIIPADAFYEWSKAPGEAHQPYIFERADGAPLALAGLWETWHAPGPRCEVGEVVRSCTILTTQAGQNVGDVHDRAPVVLEPGETLDAWLDPDITDPNELEPLLRASPAGTLVRHRVGPAIGRAGVDGPALAADISS